jgi:CRP-like cAMP-binding protein
MNAAHTAPSDPLAILAAEDKGRSILHCQRGRVVFYQGDPADSVYYIEKGRVELTVVSREGRHGVIGILESRDFFGEECLGGDSFRIATAKTIAPCLLMKIAKAPMRRLVHEAPSFGEIFISWLLSRNIRLQEDLADELLNSAEKRLARALLLLADISGEGKPTAVIPRISQETLAKMIGTSRQTVNYFMSKFRRLRFIEYDVRSGGRLIVHGPLLDCILNNPAHRRL